MKMCLQLCNKKLFTHVTELYTSYVLSHCNILEHTALLRIVLSEHVTKLYTALCHECIVQVVTTLKFQPCYEYEIYDTVTKS